MTETVAEITVRWIDEDNAASLGYEPEDYPRGGWVGERNGEWWQDLDAIWGAGAQDADKALRYFGDLLREQGRELGFELQAWEELPANYGTVYRAVIR